MTFYAPNRSNSSNLLTNPTNNINNIIKQNNDPYAENLLHPHEDRFCTYSTVNIFTTTFNVNGKSPPESLHHWLSFDTTSLPDIIAIGLQEMDLNATSLIMDNVIRQDEWLFKLKRTLPNIYKQVTHVRLTGVFLVLYYRENSKIKVSNEQICSIPTGFLKFANKGGVGISLRLNDTLVCFVNSHLAAGSNELPKRNQDFREISQMRFANGHGLYDHEIVFWLGDLNYRLNHLNYDDAVVECNSNRYQKLIYFDQLKEQQRLKTAFNGFHEQIPTFRPTYKFNVGTSNWDSSEKRRTPAWCDRILYWVREKSIKIQQTSYTSIEKVCFSDHKPVCSTFNLVVKCIDWDKRFSVYEEVLKENDKHTNDRLPQILLSETDFKFGEVYFNQPAVSLLIIKNNGLTSTNFSFASIHQSDDMPNNWLTITPKSSFLEVDAEIEVQLQVVINDKNVANDRQLNCVLVIKLDHGRDYFVVVEAIYKQTTQQKEPETEKIIASPNSTNITTNNSNNNNDDDDDWLIKFD